MELFFGNILPGKAGSQGAGSRPSKTICYLCFARMEVVWGRGWQERGLGLFLGESLA